MSILRGSYYSAARGGHAPGDLREAFFHALEAFASWEDGEPEPSVELREQDVPISRVFGLMWNCSDILPGIAVYSLEDVGIEGCRTYGAAARQIRLRMRPTRKAMAG